MKQEPLAVLLVDDDDALAEMTERLLAGHGMKVTRTGTSLGVSNLTRRLRPDIVLLDVELPALTGDAVVALLRKSAPPNTRIVLYSSHDETTLRSISRRTGVDGWVSKSVDPDTLVRYLVRLVRLGAHSA
jgi:two-component system, OmpR family, response regulator